MRADETTRREHNSMSVAHIAWAFEQRTGAMSRKLVLVALANRINPDTGTCWPSVRRIMAETELGRMTVFRALENLESQGLISRIERTRENGSRTSSEYRFPSVTVIRGEYQSDTGGGVTVIPPEPEVRNESRTIAAKPRQRNEIWDALTVMFGEPTTRNNQKLRGQVCSELRAAGATPDEILARGKRWPHHFENATLTETALLKHWDRLGRKPLRAGR